MNYSRRQYLLGSVASILALQTAGAKPLNNMSAPTPPVAERRPTAIRAMAIWSRIPITG